jgi:hypothetical protein
MKNTLTLGLAACMLLSLNFGCRKDCPPDMAKEYPDFANLKVGNYWIYERFMEKNGVLTPLNKQDSNYVEKDTLINGISYHKLMARDPSLPRYNATYLRDSLHYLVDHVGTIYFSSENFRDTLRVRHLLNSFAQDTIATLITKMTDDNLPRTVAAGTFVTKNFNTTMLVYPNYVLSSAVFQEPRRYAENVGIVEESLGCFLGGGCIMRQLKRYGRR